MKSYEKRSVYTCLCVILGAYLFVPLYAFAYLEVIENMAVDVVEETLCPICLSVPDEGGKVATPDGPACQSTPHAACRVCLENMRTYSQRCPECRSFFTNIVDAPDTALHFEYMVCLGCDKHFSRGEINAHLKVCANSASTLTDIEDQIKTRVINYLSEHSDKMQADNTVTQDIDIYSVDENDSIARLMERAGLTTPADSTAYVTSGQQCFYNIEKMPYLTVTELGQLKRGGKDSKDLLYVSSMCSQHGQRSFLSSAPDEIKHFFSPEVLRTAFFETYHSSLVAIQEKAAPLTIGLSFNESGDQINFNSKDCRYYLIYSAEVPGQRTHWGVKEIKKHRRLLIEVDDAFKLVLPSVMTKKEETEIQIATGRSVRENPCNSIKYSLCIAMRVMDDFSGNRDDSSGNWDEDDEVLGFEWFASSRGGFHSLSASGGGIDVPDAVSRGVTNSARVFRKSSGSVSTQVIAKPQAPQATFKLLSDKPLPVSLRYSERNIPQQSLFFIDQIVLYLDVINTPYPISQRSMPKVLIEQLARQQLQIKASIESAMKMVK